MKNPFLLVDSSQTKMQLLPNGSILAVGNTPRFFYASNDDVMLMKLDSNGCLGGYPCDTLNLITGLNTKPVSENLSAVFLYPNPSTGEFYVDFPKGLNKLDVDIYNGLGQLVKKYRQVTRNKPLIIKMKGIYFVRLSKNGHILASKTVLIE